MKWSRMNTLAIVCWLTLALMGCGKDDPDKPPLAEQMATKESEALTPEEAHKSLLDMDSNDLGGRLGWDILMRETKTAAIEKVSRRICKIGPWDCNLAERTFSAVLTNPQAIRHPIIEWLGVFERTSDGKWRAKITKYTH